MIGANSTGSCGFRWITSAVSTPLNFSPTGYLDGIPLALVVRIVVAVANALDYAHKQGLLHSDVKPVNVMLAHPYGDGAEQWILLADSGIARNVDDISGLNCHEHGSRDRRIRRPRTVDGRKRRRPR